MSSRLSLDDLGELFDADLEQDDVDTVLGLMAKELNKVPLPGAAVRFNDLELVAERAAGRRHTIQTALVSRLSDADLDVYKRPRAPFVGCDCRSSSRRQRRRPPSGC